MKAETTSDLQKALGLGVAVLVLIALVATYGKRVMGAAAGPEAEILADLKKVEQTGLEIRLPHGLLVSPTVHYQRLQVSVAGDLATVNCTLDFTGVFDRTTNVSSLGYETIHFRNQGGSWEPETSLAPRLVGIVTALEHRRRVLSSVTEAAQAELTQENLPAFDLQHLAGQSEEKIRLREHILQGVRAALVRDAGPEPDAGADFPLPKDDARIIAMTDRRYKALAWFIRSERDEVSVSEDYQLVGTDRGNPVDEKATPFALAAQRFGRSVLLGAVNQVGYAPGVGGPPA